MTYNVTFRKLKQKFWLIQLVLWLVCLFLLPVTSTLAQSGEKSQSILTKSLEPRVLVLHSYHHGFTWSDNISKGIQSVLKEQGRRIEVLFEFMDTRRINSKEYFQELKNLYKTKYAERKIEVIICCDDHAFNFILENGEDIFPDVPMVFCSVSGYQPWMRQGRQITGLQESIDIKSTLDTALKLHSGIKEVAVITDMTRTGRALKITAEKVFRNYKGRVKFRYLENLTIEELQENVASLSKGTLVFLFIFSRDKAGRVFSHEENLKILAEKCNVPIYAVWEFYLGHGIVGGKLTSGVAEGRMAGEMAKRILQGERALDIPLQESPVQYMFDSRQLERFNIQALNLPQESIIINRPFSFYETYKTLIWRTIAVIFVLCVVIGFLMQNIIMRRKAEDALGKSEKMYRFIADNVQDVIWTRDMDLRLTYISPSILVQQGYTVKEAMERTLEETWPSDSLKLVREVFAEELKIENQEEAKDLSRSRTLEVEVKCKDGETIWTEAKMSFLRDQTNSPTGIIGVTRDISERKQTEAALRESEERYRLLVENANEAIFIVEDGMVKFPNFKTVEMTGYSEKELSEIPFANMIHADDREMVLERRRRRLLGETLPSTYSFRMINKSGGELFVQINTVLINWAGRPATINFIRDITEQKRLEDQLQQAKKMEALGILAGGVAHDLNNVLSGIVSYPDLLLMQIPEDSPLIKPILTMQDSGKKAADIVQDLLTLARRGVVAEDVVNLNEIISEYLKNPEHEKLKSFHPRVEVVTSLEPDLFNISGSPVHLSKTVMNLVSNAAEAMPDGGKIFISTENRYIDKPISGYDSIAEGDYTTLTVSDTGIGISPEDRERIFEPFYTKKVMGRSGTGLGVAVVWGTVKDHKGYIDVQSIEGKGTTFTLYFPATRRTRANEKAVLPIEHYRGKGESILVVDDAKKQREIVSNLLTTLGYMVDTVSSGEKAIDYMKKNTVDLLILDMIMGPGIDGLETYKKIIEIHPRQKAIISSGFSETDRVREAQRIGAGEYIKKPYTLEKIGIAVRAELDK